VPGVGHFDAARVLDEGDRRVMAAHVQARSGPRVPRTRGATRRALGRLAHSIGIMRSIVGGCSTSAFRACIVGSPHPPGGPRCPHVSA
jgi:hypothetical protein